MCEVMEYVNVEKINSIGDEIINVFSANKEYLTKTECNDILNIIFESLFEKKLKKSDFDNIFDTMKKKDNDYVYKNELEPIITSLIVCFDVNLNSLNLIQILGHTLNLLLKRDGRNFHVFLKIHQCRQKLF